MLEKEMHMLLHSWNILLLNQRWYFVLFSYFSFRQFLFIYQSLKYWFSKDVNWFSSLHCLSFSICNQIRSKGYTDLILVTLKYLSPSLTSVRSVRTTYTTSNSNDHLHVPWAPQVHFQGLPHYLLWSSLYFSSVSHFHFLVLAYADN